MKPTIWPVVLFFVFALIFANELRKKNEGKGKGSLAYRRRKFLSAAERSFFGILEQAVGNDFQIFTKVRIADLVSPEKGLSRNDWQRAFNVISGKHIDFLLCRKDSLEVECAIELNDGSHYSEERGNRDKMIEEICRSASIPFLQVPAQKDYQLPEVRNSISNAISMEIKNCKPL